MHQTTDARVIIEELQGIRAAEYSPEARMEPLSEPDPLKVLSGALGDPGPNLSVLERLEAKAEEAKALTGEPKLEDISKDLAQMEELIAEAKKDPHYGQDADFTTTVDSYSNQIKPLQQFLIALQSMDNDPMKLAEAFGGGGGLMSMNRAQRRAHEKKLRKAKTKR